MRSRERIVDTMLTPDEKLGVVRYRGGNIKSIVIAFSRIGNIVFALSVISALHHGDEAMSKVEELIRAKSQELSRPIIHQDTPWNTPSEMMFKRHGYKHTGRDRRTRYKVYEKTDFVSKYNFPDSIDT